MIKNNNIEVVKLLGIFILKSNNCFCNMNQFHCLHVTQLGNKVCELTNKIGKRSLDRISLDRNCHFSLDRKF
jgi:hypothetical protein